MCTFSACTSSGKGGKEETLYSGEIRIAVDESFKPIMEEELQVYHALTPEALITPIYCSEVEAVNLLLKDSVRLAVTNRRLTEEELISFHTRKFFPESILMALSGVALITHHSNPDSLITVEEFRRIATGETTEWKGLNPDSQLTTTLNQTLTPSKSIVTYQNHPKPITYYDIFIHFTVFRFSLP
jgi:phosphate transport system substrate-binding protein